MIHNTFSALCEIPDKIVLKRAYLPPSADDGLRILVERLWPRGLTKEKASVVAIEASFDGKSIARRAIFPERLVIY